MPQPSHNLNQERLQSDVVEIVVQIVKMVIMLVRASFFQIAKLVSLNFLVFVLHGVSDFAARRSCFATSWLASGGPLERIVREEHG